MWLHHFTFPPATSDSFSFSTSFSIVLTGLFDYSHLVGMKWYRIVILICIFLMTNSEYLFMSIIYKEEILPPFFVGFFLLLSWKSFVCVLMSNCCNTICWKNHLYCIELLLHLGQKSIGHIHVGVFLGSLFCSTDLCLFL